MSVGKGSSKRAKRSHREGARKGGRLTIREINEQKDGYRWTTFLVRGWQEDGRWQKKRFKSRADAEAFVALKSVELINSGTRLREVVTALSPAEVKEAEAAINRLKELDDATGTDRIHTLLAAVEFYAKHHDAGTLEHIPFADAKRQFLIAKEKEGVRPRSLVQLTSTLTQFETHVDGCGIAQVSTTDVESYLNGLRSKDGKHKAATKTFNNYRADLHVFFGWCLEQEATDESGRKARWHNVNPVAAVKKRETTERDVPETLSVKEVQKLLRYVETYKGTKDGTPGIMAPYFAMALFAVVCGPAMMENSTSSRHIPSDRS
ncbi:MAG: phage integrase N-terminal SAM-like domain-containing protein [Verrucomicrobiaceae bacterium]|nr:phage integrase N-terminal SAM-like domain-containing protein [Verrucomicrobiaceae bacterium]